MNPATGPAPNDHRRHTVLGHHGTADDIAAMAAHLASQDARHITGARLLIDSGYAA